MVTPRVVAALAALGLLGAAACCRRAQVVATDRPTDGDHDPIVSGVERWRWPTPARWAPALSAAGIAGDADRWWRVAVGAVALVLVTMVVAGGVAAAILAGAGVAGCTVGALHLARHRADRHADGELPALLDHVARSTRSGASLEQALAAAGAGIDGRHGDEARQAVARVSQGVPLDRALEAWEADHPRPGPRLALAALGVAAYTGGPRARSLEAVATTLRTRAAASREAEAQASQALASAGVLVATPVAFAALTAAADARVAATLLRTPLGLGCIAGAGLLDAAGAWWMHRIVRSAR